MLPQFHRWLRAFVGLFVLGAGGCTAILFEQPSSSPSSLPTPRMSPDTVVLEVATVVVPPGDEARGDAIWQAIDEQHLPPQLRTALAANGLRCGMVGARMPPELEQLLKEQMDSGEPKAKRAADADPNAVAVVEAERVSDLPRQERRRLQSRAGRRGEVLLTTVRDRMSLVEVSADKQLRGREYLQAQGLLAIVTQPQGDGRVRLDLLPEVHHGEPKQRYQGQAGVFHIELGRDRQTFDALRIDTLIAPGQTLALSCSAEPRGLGQQLFVDANGALPGRKILLIRLAQTQFDDLFAPEQVVAPLVVDER